MLLKENFPESRSLAVGFALLLLPLLSVSTLGVLAFPMTSHLLGAPRDVAGAANSLDLQQAALFAVAENNKKANSDLKLVRVVSATKQVVSGSLTKLKLLAADAAAGTVAEYEASVWEKPWENFKETTEFNLVSESPRPLTDEESAAVKACTVLTDAGSTASA